MFVAITWSGCRVYNNRLRASCEVFIQVSSEVSHSELFVTETTLEC